MQKILYTSILCLFSFLASAQNKGILLIDFKPYEDYFINIDGKAYHTNKSSVIITDIAEGNHDMIIVPKARDREPENFELITNGKKNHFVLQKRLDGLHLIEQERLSSPDQYISDIVIQADSIVTEQVVEEVETDCYSYSDYEMNFIEAQYIQSRNKNSYLQKAFKGKCIKPDQLLRLLEVSLTTEEEIKTLKTLVPYITSNKELSTLDSEFRNTPYYKEYLKILQENE